MLMTKRFLLVLFTGLLVLSVTAGLLRAGKVKDTGHFSTARFGGDGILGEEAFILPGAEGNMWMLFQPSGEGGVADPVLIAMKPTGSVLTGMWNTKDAMGEKDAAYLVSAQVGAGGLKLRVGDGPERVLPRRKSIWE